MPGRKAVVALPIAITTKDRIAHMAACVAVKAPKVKHYPANASRVSIVCYGPTLRETYQQIKGPMITVSGAHDWMINKGYCPSYHVEIDPRLHKLAMLTPMQGVSYMIASVCHPGIWPHLRGHKVAYWHAAHDPETMQWIKDHDQTAPIISGGSVAGLAAIAVGHFLGYRKFDVYGMDCCLVDGDRHAGNHTGAFQPIIRERVAGREFFTTPQLLQAAHEMLHWRDTFKLDLTFHGDSLLSALVAETATC